MTNGSMIRGALPLAWLALIGSMALLYGLPVSDPVWGPLVTQMRHWNAEIPAFIVLVLLTFLLGLPSKQELIAATGAGIFGCVALIVLAAVAESAHIGWLLIAAFVVVVPLSGWLFRLLMLRGVVAHN